MPAGPGAGAPPGRGAGPRGDAAVRQRRPAHPAQGRRPADRGGGGLPARSSARACSGSSGKARNATSLVELSPPPRTSRNRWPSSGRWTMPVLKGALQACQAFVFPTLQDFIGRVVVEALSAGAPVVVSPMTGAVGTIVHDGVNGIVVDPHDARRWPRRCIAPPTRTTSRALRDGVRRTNAAAAARGGRRHGAAARSRGRGTAANAHEMSRDPRGRHGRLDRGVAVQTEQVLAAPTCASARSSRCAARPRSWPRSTRTASWTGCRSCPRCCAWCGQRFRVDKLALKLCDTIDWTGMYRMRDAVHLEGSRCDGQAHGGCQAGCIIYWKEAWLKRIPAGESAVGPEHGRARRPLHAGDADRGDAPAPRTPPPPARSGTRARRPSCCGPRPSASRRGTSGSTCRTSARATPARSPPSAPSPSACSTSTRTSAGGCCPGGCGSGTAAGIPFIEGRLQKTPEQTLGLHRTCVVRPVR